MNLEKLINENVVSTEIIDKGFSVDKKILVNEKYLIRVISLDRVERFEKVLEFQRKFHKIALCQKPIDLIVDENNGYYITEYIPGRNGLEVIQTFTDEKQRELGVIAGKELSKIHKVFKVDDFDVKEYLDTYLEGKIKVAIEQDVKRDLPEIFDMIEVVKNNIYHLYQLEGIMSHSDYHLFNMIFDDGEYKGVIDFERFRVGILLTDFRNNTPHNSDVSPQFASGIIDGYLDEIPVKNFFLLYNIHDLLLCIAAIPWIREFNPENLDEDIRKIRLMYSQKDKLDQAPPWYVGKY